MEQLKEYPNNDPIMTLEQVAEYLGMSIHTARKQYSEWQQYGVKIRRINGKGRPRFRFSEIDRMFEKGWAQ